MTCDLVEYDGDQLPAPKFATPRNPDRQTLGTRQRQFSRIWLGRDLMPWQRWVADVGGELLPDGRPAYDLVVVTLQRQGGKSHLALTRSAERCLSRPQWRSWYTAQTGMDARDQFLKFDDEQLPGTPLRKLVRTLRGNGHEAMTFVNGSTIRPHPPTEKALHGKQSDESDIDEAWSFTATEGAQLLQAIGPTQLTRPHAQTWVWSAGGTAASTWLAELVARGRAGDPGLAFFEWGIPDDMDLGDLASIATYHPAYGHTVTLDSVRKLRTLLPNDAEFARAAGNRWTEAIGGVIPAELWTSLRYPDPIPESAAVGYGAARAADGSEVALCAAGRVDDRVVVEVLDVVDAYGAGEQLHSWLGSDGVAIDPNGPSRALVDDAKRHKCRLLDMTGPDAAAGVDQLLDAMQAGRVLFRQHQQLDQAVRVAGTRRVGDGGRAWARVAAGASIATLDAATAAVWALDHQPRRKGKPVSRHAA